MDALTSWLAHLIGGLPMPLLQAWGQLATLLGVLLALLAVAGITLRPGGAWGLARSQQDWNARAFIAMGLSFVMVPLLGLAGAGVVLVPGVQTLECFKDLGVLLCVVLFGYPALVAMPPALMLSDLLEGSQVSFVIDSLPLYFITAGVAWLAHVLIGLAPDFRKPRNWARYGGLALLMLFVNVGAMAQFGARQFTPMIGYAVIAPAVLFTSGCAVLMAPLLMLAALPLARRAGLFWADIPGHVKHIRIGRRPAPVAGEAQEELVQQGVPVRIVLAGAFVALVLILVSSTAYFSLNASQGSAQELAGRLHEEIAENINLRLDAYLERSLIRSEAERMADIRQLLSRLSVAEQGRAVLVDLAGQVIERSHTRGEDITSRAEDPVVRQAVAALRQQGGDLKRLDPQAPLQFRFDVISTEPLARETWLAQATRYSDNAGRVDWVVVTALPESFYLASLRAGGKRTTLLSALSMVLALVLAGTLAALVGAPIRRISQSVAALTRGELRRHVASSPLQELDALVRAFNQMADRLQDSMERTRSSEQMVKAVFNTSPVAMMVLDATRLDLAETNRAWGLPILDMNSGWQRLSGHDPAASIGLITNELRMWKDFEERNGFTALMAKNGFVERFPAQMQRRDGSVYFGEVSVRKAQIGKLSICVFSVEDVSEHRRAQASMESLNRQIHTLLDSAVEVAIIATDTQGRITIFNHGAERMLGHGAAEMLAQPVLDVFDRAEVDACGREFAASLGVVLDGMDVFTALTQTGLASVRSWTFKGKGERKLQVSVALSATRNERDVVSGYLFLARDVSAQLAAQGDLLRLNEELDQRVRERTQALQQSAEHLQQALDNLRSTQEKLVQSEKLASLGSIVTAVAHELNTPIGIGVTVASTIQEKTDAIALHAGGGTLKRTHLDDYMTSQRNGIQLLMRSLERAQHLVGNFKRLAVNQHGGQQREAFDLKTAVEQMSRLARVTLKGTPYVLDIEIPAGIAMESFPNAIEQVFSNLVENSVAHGFGERPNGRMCLSAEQLAPGTVRLLYTDDGKGMSADALRHIFDPFYTTALGKGGSGLGMAISYNLVTGPLAGSIEVSSAPGEGVRFAISLPCMAPAREAAVVTATSADELKELESSQAADS